jgi:hypothetical protein
MRRWCSFDGNFYCGSYQLSLSTPAFHFYKLNSKRYVQKLDQYSRYLPHRDLRDSEQEYRRNNLLFKPPSCPTCTDTFEKLGQILRFASRPAFNGIVEIGYSDIHWMHFDWLAYRSQYKEFDRFLVYWSIQQRYTIENDRTPLNIALVELCSPIQYNAHIISLLYASAYNTQFTHTKYLEPDAERYLNDEAVIPVQIMYTTLFHGFNNQR